MLTRHRDSHVALGLCGHKNSAGPARHVSTGKALAHHQLLVWMRQNLPAPAHQVGVFILDSTLLHIELTLESHRTHHFPDAIQR